MTVIDNFMNPSHFSTKNGYSYESGPTFEKWDAQIILEICGFIKDRDDLDVWITSPNICTDLVT